SPCVVERPFRPKRAEGNLQTRLPEGHVLTIDDIVRKTPDLPSAPTVALAAMKHAGDPDATASSLSKILAQDQSLVLRVLRLANSAFYGARREIHTMPEAVVLLGMRTVRHLCLLASSYPWLSKALPGYGLGPKEMWIHSLSVGVGARVVAERSG